MCVKPIDATAAGMNLKQFNFLFHETQVNCLLVEKRQPGLGATNLQKRREKERKRERKREKRRIFRDKSANENVLFVSKKKREKTLFFYSLCISRGRSETKTERETKDKKDFFVVVSLTSSSSWVVPRRGRREKCSLGCD